MRKANTQTKKAGTSAKAAHSPVPESFVSLVSGIENREIQEVRAYIAYYKAEIAQNGEKIKRIKLDNKNYLLLIADYEHRLAELVRKINPQNDTEIAQALYDAITAYKWVDSVGVVNSSIQIKTKLIFADIREKAGSETHQRTCMGAYLIRFNLSSTNIGIENITFKSRFDMWSVRNSVPCFGDWGADVEMLHKKRDWGGLVDLFYHYIRASDTDGSSYFKSHSWRDARSLTATKTSIPTDSYVLITNDHEGIPLRGVFGKVNGMETDASHVVFKEEVEVMENDRDDPYSYEELCLPNNILIPISEHDYKANITTSLDYHEEIMRQIDSLPDGSKAEDAQKIIDKANKKTK